jgi:outer membrane murein-binding lipoprotein Lpp
MNKIAHTLTLVIASTFLLAGCASSAPVEVAANTPTRTAATSTGAQETATPEDPAPLSVDEETEKQAAGDEMFLTETRIRIKNIKSATDEQLISAGHKACELYDSGQGKKELRLIEGETPDEAGTYWDSLVIASWAPRSYCPEYDELG